MRGVHTYGHSVLALWSLWSSGGRCGQVVVAVVCWTAALASSTLLLCFLTVCLTNIT